MGETADFVALMGPVACHLLGEPNRRLSSDTEYRFGTNGSLSVDLIKGTWYDHETKEGGGFFDLIRRCKGFPGTVACMEWLEHEGFTNGQAPPVRKSNGAHQPQPQRSAPGREVEHYDYLDEAGSLLYQVVRYAEPKTFRQRRPDGNGGWVWNMHGVRQVPYRLAELTEALANEHTVFVVEGEKDVNNMWANGLPATCNAMGAGSWSDTLCPFFRDADVVVIADNDPQAKGAKGEPLYHKDGRPKRPGQDHAHAVAAQLSENIARRVRLIDLGRVWAQCPEKGDISNWFEAGLKTGDLWQIVEQLPDWSPELTAPPSKRPTPYNAPDPASIPRRAWLHDGHYIREAATTTVAPGGFGKTSLLLHDAICMVAKGLHVWFVSGEDPKDEIDRRIAAHCKHHNIDLSKLPGRLYVDDRTMFSLFIARSPRPASVQFDDQSLAQFAAAIVADKIDVVILDPFVSFHSVPENDNGAIDAVVKRLASIAHINKCCVEISHHVRKPFQGQASITVDDARGGGAIINAVRSGRVINRMSQHEAETAGIADDKRASYLRIDKGKRNMAPPEAASWFRIVGVIIGNDDNVQAIEPWVFPRAEQPTADDLLWLKATVKNKRYGADPRQTDWLGIAVAEHFGRDRDDKKDLAWIKGTISNWIKDKVIRRVNRLNEQKKERGFYEVVETDSAPITPAPPDLLEPEDYE